MICVGTSLRIRPAGNWPLRTRRRNGKAAPGKIVIINLQRTHLDRYASIRIFARCDTVFEALLRELDLPPLPPVSQPPLVPPLSTGAAGAVSDGEDGAVSSKRRRSE